MTEHKTVCNPPWQLASGATPLSDRPGADTLLIAAGSQLLKDIISDMIYVAAQKTQLRDNKRTYFPRPPQIQALICNIDWYDHSCVVPKVERLLFKWSQLHMYKTSPLPLSQHHYSDKTSGGRDGLMKTMKSPPTLVLYSGEFGPAMRHSLALALYQRGLLSAHYFMSPPE